MKASNLLPNRAKKLGWLVLIPALLFGVAVMYFHFEIAGFEAIIPYAEGIFSSSPTPNNLTDELAAILFLIALVLIAFSEEKDEDEFVSKIRLESLQWSVYINYGLLAIAILFIYDDEFFQVLIYNMYTILIFFILRFYYVLRVKFNPNLVETHEK
ncbi:MAG: hypothetical protein WAZ98_11245 [Cyclobacteriaceae bacterium]